MELSPPQPREEIHERTYDLRGYRRTDGLWDIEGRMTDVKGYPFKNSFRGTIAPGEPLHDMRIRMTLDDNFEVRGIEVATAAGPYAVCPGATANYQRLVGLRIGPGWRQRVKQAVGGIEGCTHHTEMLSAMATVAFQTIYPILNRERGATDKRQPGETPSLLNTCHAFRSDSPVVKELWPDVYSGDRPPRRGRTKKAGG